jgi:hypothetical protein
MYPYSMYCNSGIVVLSYTKTVIELDNAHTSYTQTHILQHVSGFIIHG